MPMMRYFNIIICHPLISPDFINKFYYSVSIPGLRNANIHHTNLFYKFFCSKTIFQALSFTIFYFSKCTPLF